MSYASANRWSGVKRLLYNSNYYSRTTDWFIKLISCFFIYNIILRQQYISFPGLYIILQSNKNEKNNWFVVIYGNGKPGFQDTQYTLKIN